MSVKSEFLGLRETGHSGRRDVHRRFQQYRVTRKSRSQVVTVYGKTGGKVVDQTSVPEWAVRTVEGCMGRSPHSGYAHTPHLTPRVTHKTGTRRGGW